MHNVINSPPPQKINCDLHTHTKASDGGLFPSELVHLAVTNGVEMLAITDHDTIAGYLSVCDTIVNLRLVSGVEISTTWGGQGIHIIGLNFDSKHPSITALLATQAAVRQARCQIILDKLVKINMPLELESVQKVAGHEHIGRPHIAQAMVNSGYVTNRNSAFKKYLGNGKVGDVKTAWVTLAETVTAINNSGGIAVIAHPNKYKMTRMKLLRLIDEFIEIGGQGIEVISSKQHHDITEKYARIANDKGLYASLGSDFHYDCSYVPSVGRLPPLPVHCQPVWHAFNSR